MSAYGNSILAGIEMIKPLLPLVPEKQLNKERRGIVEAVLDLLAAGVKSVDADGKTPDEFRAHLAEELERGWQAAIDAKFGGARP